MGDETAEIRIRPFAGADWPQVWSIVRAVVRAADTFTYDPKMTDTEARRAWLESAPGQTVVAEAAGRIVGTAKMAPNRPGPGSHISTASFMVSADARGRGVGERLVRFALAWSRDAGYAGMQFNAVAASNRLAVEPYRRFGFSIVGTVPDAFAHPTRGLVGLHIMFCRTAAATPGCEAGT